MTTAMGIDPSFTGTGIVVVHEGEPWIHEEIKTLSKTPTSMRIKVIWSAIQVILDHCKNEDAPIDIVAIEGYAYGRHNRMAMLGELSGVIKWELLKQEWDPPFDLVVVPPLSLKKWATGKGNASKDEMVDSCPIETKSPNIADAWHLANYAYTEYQSLILEI